MIQETTTTRSSEVLNYLMQNYANYNLWANQTIITWLRTKDQSLLEQTLASGHPGIKRTLVHIWQTQQYWFAIIKKQPQTNTAFEGTLEEIYTLLLESCAELAKYVSTVSEEEIQENIEVVSQWFQCNLQAFEYIQHVVNHGTHHRGQITTMGRMLGFTDAPMTDYNYYNVRGK